MKNVAVLCDFDGTVASDDVGNLLFRTFGRLGDAVAVVEKWKRGEISSRECLEKEFALLDVSRHTVVRDADSDSATRLTAPVDNFNLMTFERQVIGTGQTGRTGTNDDNLLAG